MKFQYMISTTVLTVFATSTAQNIRGAGEIEKARSLASGSTAFGCKGDTLKVGEEIHSGESICAKIGGDNDKEWTYFGLREYDMDEPGYTMYRAEIWSENETHNRMFTGIGTQGDAPFIRHQGDGHVVMAGNTLSGYCRAKPNKRGSDGKLVIGAGSLPDLLKLFDNDGDLTWKLSHKPLSNGDTFIGGSECYPEIATKCLRALNEKQRLTWNEYVCEFDSEGKVVTRFGLDPNGVLGLWRDNNQEWRPVPGDGAKADWLHLQVDGQLTAYKGNEPNLTYIWKSKCNGEDTKITVSDGDVHQFEKDGLAIWALVGSTSPQPVCLPRC